MGQDNRIIIGLRAGRIDIATQENGAVGVGRQGCRTDRRPECHQARAGNMHRTKPGHVTDGAGEGHIPRTN